MASLFAPTMEFDGTRWHLRYAPDNPLTVRPDLVGGKVVKAGCSPVKLRDRQLYLAAVEIVMPSVMEPNGRIVPEKRLLGLRVYDHMPVNPQTVDGLNFNEMVFYIAEPKEGADMQALFNAVLGRGQEREEKPSADWMKDLARDVNGGASEEVKADE